MVLDVRVYRAAFAPALIALFIAAFSLADRPGGATTPFAPAGFDGGRAYTLLGELGQGVPPAPAGLGRRPRARRPRGGDVQGQQLPRLAPHRPRSGRSAARQPLETVVGRAARALEPPDRRDGAPRRARLAGAGRAVGHGGAARDGAAVQGPRAVLDARARLDLGRERGRRGRAGVRASTRRRPDRRRDRARRHRRARDAASRGSCRGRTARRRRRWACGARSRARCGARSACRPAARARSASGRGARCR